MTHVHPQPDTLLEPVPCTRADWEVSASDAPGIKRAYDRLGFCLIPDLLTARDLQTLRDAYDSAVADGALQLAKDELPPQPDAAYRHPAFFDMVLDDRILAIVRKLIGDQVEIHHTKINSMPVEPGDKARINWHQDYALAPHTNGDMVTVGIHLDDETEDHAPLRFIPGSHTWGVLPHDEDGKFLYQCRDLDMLDSQPQQTVSLKAGDVTMHHTLAAHATGPKRATGPRRLVAFHYRAADAVQLAGPIYKITGTPATRVDEIRYARFFDGSRVMLRGRHGRLYDIYGKLAPDT
ncbi:phytanoyl-CoA dioxygenase family protein [Yunchengibacter salinarum]|uniref:phytanoyl-CoA dioxygenase family protein n=1 Tax=Yunchengibacter salinarum TaxID=3133399 RepID=UPI0035B61AE9